MFTRQIYMYRKVNNKIIFNTVTKIFIDVFTKGVIMLYIMLKRSCWKTVSHIHYRSRTYSTILNYSIEKGMTARRGGSLWRRGGRGGERFACFIKLPLKGATSDNLITKPASLSMYLST